MLATGIYGVFSHCILILLLCRANGKMEKQVESGMTYLPDNSPAAIATAIQHMIRTGKWKRMNHRPSAGDNLFIAPVGSLKIYAES
jgi:hypothetical protein